MLATRGRAHHAVEHPQRNLKGQTCRFAGQAASRDRVARFIQYTVNRDDASGPRMPVVKNPLFAGNVGVQAPSCTIPSQTTFSASTVYRPAEAYGAGQPVDPIDKARDRAHMPTGSTTATGCDQKDSWGHDQTTEYTLTRDARLIQLFVTTSVLDPLVSRHGNKTLRSVTSVVTQQSPQPDVYEIL